jgi:hypothetical protein
METRSRRISRAAMQAIPSSIETRSIRVTMTTCRRVSRVTTQEIPNLYGDGIQEDFEGYYVGNPHIETRSKIGNIPKILPIGIY